MCSRWSGTGRSLDCDGTIERAQRVGKEPAFGIRFDHLSEGDRAAITEFVDKNP